MKGLVIKYYKKLKELHYFHYINIFLTLISLALTVFYFNSTFIRIKESLRDLFSSFLNYIGQLFEFDSGVLVSVNAYSEVPLTPIFGLPATWEEFQVAWGNYWSLWATRENFQEYLAWIGNFLYYASKIILLVFVPVILVLILTFKRYLNNQNNDYNVESKFLTKYKKFIDKIYMPVKKWVKRYIEFNKKNVKYFKLWLFIWAFNFNFIVILIEFFAYYLYFVVSFDVLSLYVQLYKLLCDLSVMIAFVPTAIWIILGYLLFNLIRKRIGYRRLNHLEAKNCGFINERPIVSMTCGTMGKKKTTAITDMALSQEVIFRDKAFEKILENDLKFPNFPWINLENNLKRSMEKHLVYNLATIRQYMRHIAFLYSFESEDKAVLNSVKRRLRKLGLDYNKPLFEYDFERYGVYYNDNLKLTHITEVLETYAQLYFIYVIETSLLISNYSVRTDTIKQDLGNFPLWNDDFFKRDVRLMESYSRHAKIIDFDMLRLGKKIIEDNPKKDSFEFGVILITEVGKERKNSVTLQEVKIKELLANQKNDGFNDSLKMIRHSATVDNFPFVKIFTDEQRPSSWGADAKDLCEIVHIKESSETHLAMPFFSLTELVYSFLFSKFNNLYFQYRFNRADNTLFMYLVKNSFTLLHKYYRRIYNTFGFCTLAVQIEAGTQDGIMTDKQYYLMHKKIYSKRFSTDCFSDFYYRRALRSDIGICDFEEYETEKATIMELECQNSYFINDLTNKHNIDKE